MQRLFSFLALAPVAALLCTGCETMQPKVDMPVTSAPQLIYPTREPVSASGGLFSTATYRQAFEDRRARLVGDTVTITIVENVSASQTSTSTIDKNGTVKAGISALPFFNAASLAAKSTITAADANTFSGKGGTQSANTFTGAITATVVQVLPNGHLVVTGEKQIGVNENVDVMKFSGTIDPRAIQGGSFVSSTQVANVRIESRGRGQGGEAQQMGWLSRVFLNVLPF
jgi:flagellar L-ring protein precursor FlgH